LPAAWKLWEDGDARLFERPRPSTPLIVVGFRGNSLRRVKQSEALCFNRLATFYLSGLCCEIFFLHCFIELLDSIKSFVFIKSKGFSN
jgi:hypothetical protein